MQLFTLKFKAILSAEFFYIFWDISTPDFTLMFIEDYQNLVADLELDRETFEKHELPMKSEARSKQVKVAIPKLAPAVRPGARTNSQKHLHT